MKEISAVELKKWNAKGKDYVLIDVRESWERSDYNIGGLHIPMSELMSHADEIPRDKDVVLYCEKGIRTVIAIQRLEQAGFRNLINLSGGMKAWRESL